MRNNAVAEKGQKLVENFCKGRGWEVDDVTKRDNTLPYDVAIRKRGTRWVKIQVKTTRGAQDEKLVFRTRKSRANKKVLYDPKDLDFFIFVDAASETMIWTRYMRKGYFVFSENDWEEKCTPCR